VGGDKSERFNHFLSKKIASFQQNIENWNSVGDPTFQSSLKPNGFFLARNDVFVSKEILSLLILSR